MSAAPAFVAIERESGRKHGPLVGVAMLVVTAISAHHAAMFGDWLLENLLVVFMIGVVGATFWRLPLSNLSYWMLFLFLCIHEWGAHHKYADVPLGEWMKTILNTSRNHYDRIAHFSFGLLFAYPFQEVLDRTSGVRGLWRYYLPIDMSLAFGAVYEIIEATVVTIVSPDAGESFVGLQGDVWDAQKDIAMAGIGAAMTMLFTAASRRLKAERSTERLRDRAD